MVAHHRKRGAGTRSRRGARTGCHQSSHQDRAMGETPQALSATLIRGARVLTLDAADTEYPRADILIEGNLIVAVGPDLIPPDAVPMVIEAGGLLAMPGLINGHFHSQANLMAGSVASRPLELFMLYEVPPLGDRIPDPRLIYLQT